MVRPKRVLSFMSEWGGGGSSSHRKTPSSAGASPLSPTAKQALASTTFSRSSTALENYEWSSPSPTARPHPESRPSSRPMSMIQTYQPPVMEVGQDTLPELQRIFMFLNSHSNKLYQEGYFLKFHDTDTRGRPAPDRVWQECFAQLVGTILSLWDASELDDASGDAEVLPTFINLTDAAIHMMPSMTLSDGKKLDNVLSVSTAASNKYLFHFNSFNSLTQWTAGIRLAMFEHTSLQEAYTGALIAGKGKTLNNIRVLLDRQRAKYEDWARVRFGAGTPWRRCWCVVTPPDEKELQKLQKLQKKQNIYGRSPIILKGDVKFYETKKVTKKTKPIATVKDAYSCYAIYPQSKPLIDQSTLVKIEGKITIHSKPEVTTEGFVFVMPEARPMLSGFEIMLQFLFPVFDTFNLYGRPTKLIADVLDSRGLMFAMPPDRRYGYLEMWDVVSLIHSEGSQSWSERQWRKELKDLTSKRMTAGESGGSMRSRRNTIGRNGFPTSRNTLRFDESSIRSSPSTRQSSPSRNVEFEPQGARRVDTAPPTGGTFSTTRHQRSVSEQQGYSKYHAAPSRLAYAESLQEEEAPPTPPAHGQTLGTPQYGTPQNETSDTDEAVSPDTRNLPELPLAPSAPPRGPVEPPPTFAHAPSQKPPVQPYLPPTMKPSPQVDPATLHQMADATNAPLPAGIAAAGAAAAWKGQESLNGRRSGEYDARGQDGYMNANPRHSPADRQPTNRLPTIPASPYIEPPEFVPSPVTYQPAAPPVPEQSEQLQARPSQESARRPRPGSSSSSQIHRKPVPGRSSFSSHRDDTRSIESSSLDSLRNDVVDPAALDSLNYVDAGMLRQNSQSSSRYSDDFSASTPDYASTASEEIRPQRLPLRREDRPRSGMLKTIGDPSLTPKPDVVLGDVHYKPDAKPVEPTTDLPTIDFGPTYSLAVDANANANSKRPGTSGTMTQALHDNSFSRSKENLVSSSPNEQNRHSTHLSGRTTPIAAMHMRSSSGSPSFSETRSVAWQPGMTSQQPQQGMEKQKLDPEEWVAHRAAAANLTRVSPVYSHGRSMSHTPPPMPRTKSGDWAHLQNQLQRSPADSMPARPPSRPLSRPHSRGASTLLVDQRPVALSAREQEQVARMTNTPLIDLTRNNAKEQKPSDDGLAGYIGYREKEKAAAKANRNTLVMQAEAERRMVAAQQKQMMEMQQQQMELQQQQMLEMQQQQMGMAQGGYGTPSIYGTPQAYPQSFGYGTPTPNQMYQQQAGYFPPAGVPGAMQQQQMQQQWGSPSPQLGAPFMAQQNMSMGNLSQYPQQQQQQQQPRTQPYGASFDQAQAAARFAHQSQGQRYRGA